MTTFNDEFNIDLPGEIEDLHDENCGMEIIDGPYIASDNGDDFSWILPDGETIEDHIPDFYDDEDDSWSDSDSLASAGWGTDEDYGLWE